MYNGSFGWDDSKNDLNVKNHGFSFWIGARVFEDPHYLLDKDRVDASTGEQRWNATGLVNGLILVTSHAYREKPEDALQNAKDQFIHIIPSRKAERTEQRRYFEENAGES